MEERVAYQVVPQPNSVGIPVRWLRFLYRMAGLERGRLYHVTIIVPEQSDAEPTWAISGGSKVENGG